MENIKKLKSKIRDVFVKPYTATLYLMFDKETMRLADLGVSKTEPKLRELFYDSLKSKVVENEELTLENLSNATDAKNRIYQYDYSEYPPEISAFKNLAIPTQQSETIQKFRFDEFDLKHLCGYVIYLGNSSDGIMLYKQHYPISLIKRDSFLVGLVKSDSRLEYLDNDDMLRLNGDFQMIKVNKDIFVTDLQVLERNLHFRELEKKAAKEKLSIIKRLNIVEDLTPLSDGILDISLARKLARINSDAPIFNSKVPCSKILKFSKQNKGLAGVFEYSDDGKIVLNTRKAQEAFIKMLKDSFVKSELTKQEYEAKDKIKL